MLPISHLFTTVNGEEVFYVFAALVSLGGSWVGIKWPILRVHRYFSVISIDSEREKVYDRQAHNTMSRQLSGNDCRVALYIFISLTWIHSSSFLSFESHQSNVIFFILVNVGWLTLFSFANKKVEEWYELQGFKDKTNSGSPNLTPLFLGVEVEAHGYQMYPPSGRRTGFPTRFRALNMWSLGLLHFQRDHGLKGFESHCLKRTGSYLCGGFSNGRQDLWPSLFPLWHILPSSP